MRDLEKLVSGNIIEAMIDGGIEEVTVSSVDVEDSLIYIKTINAEGNASTTFIEADTYFDFISES